MNITDFFAPAGKFTPVGAFSAEHIALSLISLLAVAVALFLTRKIDKKRVLRIIQILTLSICVLETVKIVFTLITSSARDLNSYVPLYFCSITIYAGLLAGFAKGWWRRTGEVFLATGGIIGGLAYIAYPLTAVSIYPSFHFITVYSFLLHAAMIYLGLLLLITGYTKLKTQDIDHFVLIVTLVSVLAFAINITFHTNLMFLSQNYPGTPIEIAYKLFPGLIFPLFMYLFQVFVPFYAMYGAYRLITKKKNSQDS